MAELVAASYDPLADDEPKLARTMAASVQQHIAFGERAIQKVWRIGSRFGYEGKSPFLRGTRCTSVNGFSLHADTQFPAHRRDQLERLIRYTARGAVALEHVEAGSTHYIPTDYGTPDATSNRCRSSIGTSGLWCVIEKCSGRFTSRKRAGS